MNGFKIPSGPTVLAVSKLFRSRLKCLGGHSKEKGGEDQALPLLLQGLLTLVSATEVLLYMLGILVKVYLKKG